MKLFVNKHYYTRFETTFDILEIDHKENKLYKQLLGLQSKCFVYIVVQIEKYTSVEITVRPKRNDLFDSDLLIILYVLINTIVLPWNTMHTSGFYMDAQLGIGEINNINRPNRVSCSLIFSGYLMLKG